MTKSHLLSGIAAITLIGLPGTVLAQDAPDVSALEARIAYLEREIDLLRADVTAARTQQANQSQDIIRLDQQVAAAPPPAAAPAAPTDGFRIGNNTVRYGGFVKADYSISQYSGGDPANGDAQREFYLPGTIPVGGADEGEATDFNARQTRFWLTTDGVIGGRKVGTRVEFDFQVLPGTGDQRTTSPANPALRRAFVTIDNWLFGQEWTNFQILSVLPETADYVGPTEGTTFNRQVQVRYTRGPFSIALENPETTVTPFGAATRIVADDNTLPDLTARYTFTRPWGEAAVSGIVRQLAYETTGVGAIDSATVGWGISAAARVKVGERDDLKFMLTAGEGIGRYVGLNFANDAVLDASGELEAIPLVAGFAAYRHYWRPNWRSSLIYSFQNVDNDPALLALSTNAAAQSIRANLIWSPVPSFDVGSELSFGERELESGATGDVTRLTFFAKYGF
jgi:outer membrane murein-binding lipoprotein Lpp